MIDRLIGRVPIYTKSLDLFGYELRFAGVRSAAEHSQEGVSVQSVVEASSAFPLEALTGGQPAVVQVIGVEPEICDAIAWPKEKILLAVPAGWAVGDATREQQLGTLVQKGFQIGWVGGAAEPKLSAEASRFLKWCAFDSSAAPALAGAIKPLLERGVKILARAVETNDQYQRLQGLGADYYQGDYFERPKLVGAGGVPAHRLAALQLMARLQDPELELRVAEDLISRDVTLSYKLLRLVNSAFFGLGGRLDSIRRAVTFIGMQRLKNWATLIIMSAVDYRPREILRTALVRARLCEQLAHLKGVSDTEAHYLVGLFSLLDALIDAPMTEIVANLGLRDDLSLALTDRSGPVGELLGQAIALQTGRWAFDDPASAEPAALQKTLLDAIEWANQAQHALA